MFVIGSQSSIVATLIGGITTEMEERRDPVDNIPLRFRLNMNLQPLRLWALIKKLINEMVLRNFIKF